MEAPCIFNLTNGNIGKSATIIPLSLTRATSHLVIFSEDCRDIFKDAQKKNLLKQSSWGQSSEVEETEHNLGLQEAACILTGFARRLSLKSIASLAREWRLEELYEQLASQEMTRLQMVQTLATAFLEQKTKDCP